MDNNKVLLLFTSCRLVKGATRTSICDLHRLRIEFVPNSFYDLMEQYKGKTISMIKSNFSLDQHETIDAYFSYIIDNEFGFLCDLDEVELYPEVNSEWEYPAQITNGIIDIDINSNHNFKEIFLQYENLGCKNLLLRSYCVKDIEFWDSALSSIRKSSFTSIEIVTKYLEVFNEERIVYLLKNNRRIRSITFTAAEKTKNIFIEGCSINYYEKEFESSACCGNISPKTFRLNNELFLEGFNYNNCLNRKISIDIDGKIKSCPSMKLDFGNIENMSLIDVLSNANFNSLWHVTKDKIDVCKDCEFRYICTDCRAFISEEDNLYSKPKKCNYDPYQALWKK